MQRLHCCRPLDQTNDCFLSRSQPDAHQRRHPLSRRVAHILIEHRHQPVKVSILDAELNGRGLNPTPHR